MSLHWATPGWGRTCSQLAAWMVNESHLSLDANSSVNQHKPGDTPVQVWQGPARSPFASRHLAWDEFGGSERHQEDVRPQGRGSSACAMDLPRNPGTESPQTSRRHNVSPPLAV